MHLLFVGTLIALVALVCQVVAEKEKFLYFAYGSNLLHKRIQIHNPSAEFVGSALLPGWRLDFTRQSKKWNGAVATIVKDHESHTWGALWLIDLDQMDELDKQEHVPDGWYYAANVTVWQANGEPAVARTYIETQIPPSRGPHQRVPMERRPSNTYMLVISFGAIESKLPKSYIDFLVAYPTNGEIASKKRRQELEHFYDIFDLPK